MQEYGLETKMSDLVEEESGTEEALSLAVSKRLVLPGSLAKPKGSQYTFLAQKQSAKFAITPVHTRSETSLFRELCQQLHIEIQNAAPDTWIAFSKA
jgi:hypothetical protein